MGRLIGICSSIALIVAVACGGGAQQPVAQGTSGAAPTSGATAAATSAATAAATAASGPSLADLLKAGKLSTYKVTYKWTITASGQTIDSQQTWYYKAPKARFDYAIGGASGATFSVYSLEDGTYLCTSAGGSAFCSKTSQQSAFQQNPAADLNLQVSGRPDQFSASYQGSKTIAGQAAQCYGVKSTVGAGFGDVISCYSTTGVPLSMQISSQGSTVTMEATSFSTTVTDADFQLPGPVR